MISSPLLRCILWTGGTATGFLAACGGTLLVLGAMATPILNPTGLPPSHDDVLLFGAVGLTGFLLTLFTVGKVANAAAGYWRSWVCPQRPRLAWPAVALAAAVATSAIGIL